MHMYIVYCSATQLRKNMAGLYMITGSMIMLFIYIPIQGYYDGNHLGCRSTSPFTW